MSVQKYISNYIQPHIQYIGLSGHEEFSLTVDRSDDNDAAICSLNDKTDSLRKKHNIGDKGMPLTTLRRSNKMSIATDYENSRMPFLTQFIACMVMLHLSINNFLNLFQS